MRTEIKKTEPKSSHGNLITLPHGGGQPLTWRKNGVSSSREVHEVTRVVHVGVLAKKKKGDLGKVDNDGTTCDLSLQRVPPRNGPV